ncbi:DUF6077 domain-containing protein [Anaerosacchariphilus polymeriproducens]|uniref:Uncharacterized protein n=1 Tax=Anaerosacchariphilus polymeriproducens TaxID=1812858 RepID=A0A371ARJ4_9FIRM|nr:DUF6077 domain-containing protein [Anaerosacchariphilus polymeriproducens]RDU22090.1 hypothetical protein DWV06_16300 [Anaerosacchariphilus polymeriproducens]
MGISILILLLLLVICPVLIGTLVIRFLKSDKESILLAYVSGLIGMLMMFQIIALPIIFLHWKFHVLAYAWGIAVSALSGISVLVGIINGQFVSIFHETIRQMKKMDFRIIIAIGLILMQMGFVGYFQHIDDDDATYIGTAVTTWSTDTMYKYSHNTGKEFGGYPARHMLAPFPIFIASVAKLSQMHPTILAHTFLPMILIGFTYCVFFLIGKEIWKNDWSKIGIFMLFVCALNLFGYQSVYTTSTFLLVRIWQGKAVLANVILPLLLCLFIRIVKQKESLMEWFLIFNTMVAATLVSSMGVVLAPVVLGSFVLFYAVFNKKFITLVKTIVCCIPCVICGILYLLIK